MVQSDAITGRFPAYQIKTKEKKNPAPTKQHRTTCQNLSSVPSCASSCVKNHGGEKIEECGARGQDRKAQTGREQRSQCFLLSSHIQKKWWVGGFVDRERGRPVVRRLAPGLVVFTLISLCVVISAVLAGSCSVSVFFWAILKKNPNLLNELALVCVHPLKSLKYISRTKV